MGLEAAIFAFSAFSLLGDAGFLEAKRCHNDYLMLVYHLYNEDESVMVMMYCLNKERC